MPTNTETIDKADQPEPAPKTLWRTHPKIAEGKSGNQERIVFGVEGDDVYYGSRGGNVKNQFNSGVKTSIERFLEDAEFVRLVSDDEWASAKESLKPWLTSKQLYHD